MIPKLFQNIRHTFHSKTPIKGNVIPVCCTEQISKFNSIRESIVKLILMNGDLIPKSFS